MNQSLISVSVLLFATVCAQYRYNQQLMTRSCVPGGPTPVLYGVFSPCYDTPGCQMPYCCGGVAGQLINFTFTYTAKKNAIGGTVHANLTGLTLTTPNNDPLKFLIPLAIPDSLVENVLKVEPNMCINGPKGEYRHDFCPQIFGNNYTWLGSLQWPPLFNTATVILEFEDFLKEGNEEILCFKLWGRIVAPNILSSLPNLLPLNLGQVLG